MTSQTSTTLTFRFLVYGTCEWTTTQTIILPANSNITIQSALVNLDAVLSLKGPPFDITGTTCTFIVYGMRVKMFNVYWTMSDRTSLFFTNSIVENYSIGLFID
jgi:hypothetical protein